MLKTLGSSLTIWVLIELLGLVYYYYWFILESFISNGQLMTVPEVIISHTSNHVVTLTMGSSKKNLTLDMKIKLKQGGYKKFSKLKIQLFKMPRSS